ncbi:MAG TPA: hypothetical protein VJL59_08180 [Anaerolineales bacterium]|nr:hypothetical protein [Anaerolineales bacterium]HLB46991.1 hypothetical protein [Anaerolineales bacterium]
MKPSRVVSLIFVFIFLPVWLAACATTPPTPAPTVTVASEDTVVIVQSGGDERLRELATRLLTPRAFSVEDMASYQTPQLIVGGLPDGLPLDLPMPDDATLLGSMTQRSAWEGVTVALDVSLPKESVAEFYTQEFGKQGFAVWERPFPSEPPPGTAGVTLCRRDNWAEVGVFAYEAEGKPTEVQIHILTDPRLMPCAQDYGVPGPMPFADSLMPSLTQPLDAKTGSMNLFSTGKASFSTELYSALSVKDIAAHYNAQIEDAGWKLIGQDEDELVARSSWSLTDKFDGEWAGVLLVTAGPLEWSSRFVIFQIELK